MNITSAQYIKVNDENDNIKIIVDGKEMSVPLDPANVDYQEILKQVKEGTLTIKDAE